MFNQYKLEYSFKDISCLNRIAEDKPISKKSSVNPKKKRTKAISPKSEGLRQRARIETFKIPKKTTTILEKKDHFVADNK